MSLYPIVFLLVAGLGAYLRFQTTAFLVAPWGTFLVNIVGSLLIGFLALTLKESSPVKVLILVAFLGSLTTFSSYSLDLVRLFDQGQIGKALLYFFSTNIFCFTGCYFGWRLALMMRP